MRLSRWSLLLFVVGLLTPLAWAGTAEDFAAWRAMPADQQRKIAGFVQEWRSLDVETRNRLRRVLVRYTDWLSRLTPEQVNSIEQLPTLHEKVKRIRQLREQQWVARLPKADRDNVQAAKTDTERQKQVAELRAKERRRELAWQLHLIRNEDHERFGQEFAKLAEDLKGKLRPEDQQRLAKSLKQGWPDFPKTVIELAQKYKQPIPPIVESRVTLLTSYPRLNFEKVVDLVQEIEDETVRERYLSRLHGDPEQREETVLELTRLYWEMHPHVLKRVREAEEQRKKQRQMGK